MINEKLFGHQDTEYRSLSTRIMEEYKNCPWADNFVKGFAKWLQEVDVFTWKNGVMPKSLQGSLDALLEDILPHQLAPELWTKIGGKGTNQLTLMGFLMGRALASAALDHEHCDVQSVSNLQYRWWSYPGFTSVIVRDMQAYLEKSRSYRMAQRYIEWLESYPEKGIYGKREQQRFSHLCKSWRSEGTLAGLWDNSFGWQHFSTSSFEESIISDFLAVAPSLILPLVDAIRIPTIIDNIFRDTEIQYNPDLLQLIMSDAPTCTDVIENSHAEAPADLKIPVWNRSIVAPSILSFIVGYAQALLDKKETEGTEIIHEAADFLQLCAKIMISRPDGLYLARHYVRELHHSMSHQMPDSHGCALFLDAIVDAVESQGKNTLLMRWITLDFETRLKNYLEEDWKRFMQTGLQSKKQDWGELEALAAQARLLPFTDLQGSGGEMLQAAYEHLFCVADTGFYTSEHSTGLPSPMHDALSWIFLSTDTEHPAEKWEQTWNKLGSATNRIFRDFFNNGKLDLMYVLNFHLAVGLALADCTYRTHGEDCAKKVIHRLFDHLLDRLRMTDRIDDFYRKMVRIAVCKIYLYSRSTNNGQVNNAILTELAMYLRAMQSFPMLTFESMETLVQNGLELVGIKSCQKLKKVALDAYDAARVHDKNDHWKTKGPKTITRKCERMIDQLKD